MNRYYSAMLFTVVIAAATTSEVTAQPPAPTVLEVIPTQPLAAPRIGAPEQWLTADVNSFFHQLNDANPNVMSYVGAQKHIKAARRGYFGGNEWFNWWPNYRGSKINLDDLKIEELEETSATIVLTYTIPTGEWAQTAKETFTLNWATMPNGIKQWQFVPTKPGPHEFLANAPLRWAVYMLSQQPGSLDQFRAIRSQNNLKQLGLGVAQFVQDWDERYAFTSEFAQEAIRPYLRNDLPWTIPGTTQHYTFNDRLSERELVDVNETTNTILFYEGTDEKPLFRYGGKAAICMVDGHVELVTPERFDELRWKP